MVSSATGWIQVKNLPKPVDMLVKDIGARPAMFRPGHGSRDQRHVHHHHWHNAAELIFSRKGSFSIFDESVHRPRMVQASALELSSTASKS